MNEILRAHVGMRHRGDTSFACHGCGGTTGNPRRGDIIDRGRHDPLVNDLGLGAKALRNARRQTADPILDLIAHGWVEPARGATHANAVGDHIERVPADDLANADDAAFRRVDCARDNGLQRTNNLCGNDETYASA
jgi:hypothetical protein